MNLEALVLEFLGDAEISAALLSSFTKSKLTVLSESTVLGGVNFARRSEAMQVLGRLRSSGLVRKNGEILTLAVDFSSAEKLQFMLHGANLALRNGTQADTKVVLTPPRDPNSLIPALTSRGPKTTQIQDTKAVFQHLAHEAQQRLIVMAPFLDESGAEFLLDLFNRCKPNVDKVLILRFLGKGPSHPSYPKGFDRIKDGLEELGVCVHDYSIPKKNTSWLETFHAKVFLADSNLAYIGSSNINQHSLDNSMEVGVLLQDTGSLELLVDIVESAMQISPVHIN
ncbi:MAG: phospholipase D-like domain-containing protein [Pseudomonadota bacterium]